MAKKGIRIIVTLACINCKRRNYTTEKNRQHDPDRMEFTKYCPGCRAHTKHKETR